MIGLGVYYIQIPKAQTEYHRDVDAVVILTGGSMRLDSGFEAFKNSNAKKILISGVGKGVQKQDILKNLKANYEINYDDIILGELAKSTDDNAVEAKIFMDLNNYNSMLLVTSNYHIPRSTFIFRMMMPNFDISPLAVDNSPEDYRIKLIINEYNKLLGAIVFHFYDQTSDAYINVVYKVAEFLQT